jgi:probable F420-dependent oxidoreductase
MSEFGIGLPIVQQVPAHAAAWESAGNADDLRTIAAAADRLGYAWLACSDHVAIPASHAPAMGATWYDPATTLAYLAAVTTRIRLLTHVLVLPYRHPLATAKLVATLDALSAGRVIIGAGAGHLKPEFRSLGVDHADRAAIADEYVAALAAALEADVSSFSGDRVRWRDMIVAPRPVQRPRPPIWLGGNSRAAAARAGRRADGWIPWELTPAALAAGVAALSAARRATGRSGRVSIVAPVAAGRVEDIAALRDEIAAWRAAGATAFHVSFRHHSADDLVGLLERFAAALGLPCG